jgi:hypothetical protein
LNIDLLLGNLFQCYHGRHELPIHDPQYTSYACASDAIDDSIFVWLGIVGIIVLFIFYDQIFSCCTKVNANCLQMYHYAKGRFKLWMRVYNEFKPNNRNLFRFGLVLNKIRWWLCYVTCLILLLLLPIYVGLTFGFGTYAFPYVWVISIAYLSGPIPIIVLVVVLFFFLVTWYYPTHRFGMLNIFHINYTVKEEFEQVVIHKINTTKGYGDEEKQSIRLHFLNSFTTIPDIKQDHKKFCWIYLWLIFYILITVSTIIAVNVGYVYAVNFGQVSFYQQQLLSVSLSLIKLVWNGLMLEWMYYHLNGMLIDLSLPVEDLQSKRSQLLAIMLWMSLFNNTIVPIIAVGFVDPNCFVYTIRSQAPVETTINFVGCTEQGTPRPNGLGYELDLNCKSQVDPYTLSYNPPFKYSYECTSSLLSTFVDIFIYRFVLSGIVLPFGLICLKRLQKVVLKNFGWNSTLFWTLSMLLPRELRPVKYVPDELDTNQSSESISDQNTNRNPTLPASSFDLYYRATCDGVMAVKDLSSKLLQPKPETIQQVLDFADVTERSMCLNQYIIIFVTDIAIILMFGTLFPPLAVIGCSAIITQTLFLQLSFGRIVYLSTRQPKLKRLVLTLNEECVGMGKLLMRGLFSLPWLLSLLWSWFLFDILGDQWQKSALIAFAFLPIFPLIVLPCSRPKKQKDMNEEREEELGRSSTNHQHRNTVENILRVSELNGLENRNL